MKCVRQSSDQQGRKLLTNLPAGRSDAVAAGWGSSPFHRRPCIATQPPQPPSKLSSWSQAPHHLPAGRSDAVAAGWGSSPFHRQPCIALNRPNHHLNSPAGPKLLITALVSLVSRDRVSGRASPISRFGVSHGSRPPPLRLPAHPPIYQLPPPTPFQRTDSTFWRLLATI